MDCMRKHYLSAKLANSKILTQILKLVTASFEDSVDWDNGSLSRTSQSKGKKVCYLHFSQAREKALGSYNIKGKRELNLKETYSIFRKPCSTPFFEKKILASIWQTLCTLIACNHLFNCPFKVFSFLSACSQCWDSLLLIYSLAISLMHLAFYPAFQMWISHWHFWHQNDQKP